MKEEIKEILEALKPHDKEFASVKEYPLVLSVKEQKILLDYITNLQDRIDKALDYLEIFVEVDTLLKGDMVQPAINMLKGDDR